MHKSDRKRIRPAEWTEKVEPYPSGDAFWEELLRAKHSARNVLEGYKIETRKNWLSKTFKREMRLLVHACRNVWDDPLFRWTTCNHEDWKYLAPLVHRDLIHVREWYKRPRITPTMKGLAVGLVLEVTSTKVPPTNREMQRYREQMLDILEEENGIHPRPVTHKGQGSNRT